MLAYNPLDVFYKSITGAVPSNKKVTFRVKGEFDSVVLLLKKDANESFECFPMEKMAGYFEVKISFSKGLYFYKFSLSDGRFIGQSEDLYSQIGYDVQCFQLTAYSRNYKVPVWINGGIIYQIFPDRFCRSSNKKTLEEDKVFHENLNDIPQYNPNSYGKVLNNDFFGGDLKGIASKLTYLKSLGVSAIYLNPIFKAYSNHRYDTGNYMEIDPLLGDKNDFITLVKKADRMGIKIILDGVFNHTGDDSLYFNKYGKYQSLGAYQSTKSKYYKWFDFKNYPYDYESWWGIKTLPSVNENCQSYINYITGKNGVLTHYTKLGIGGWRLDVVDELPGKFVKKIRKAVKSVNKDAIIIGEVWEDASNKISYGERREYFHGFELDSVMNYPLKNAIIDFVKQKKVNPLVKTIREQIDHYPSMVLHSLMNILSTHDTVRLLSALSNESIVNKTKEQLSLIKIPDIEKSEVKFKLKCATLLQFTLFGVPSIYYGDEAGMEGYVDPLNRRFFPWGKEDKEIVEWYKFLGGLRAKYSAFVDGKYEQVFASDGTLIFKRKNKESEILICVNVGKVERQLEFSGKLYNLIDKNRYKDKYLLKGGSIAVFVNK